MRNKILAALLLPEILLVLFFGWAYIISPPSAGKELAEAARIPHKAVIAHRGASFYAPEETRPAYLLARELGVDYLEMDVQRTRDGVLVAFHDTTLARTTNVAEIFPGREKDLLTAFTWAELQELETGSSFNGRRPEFARPGFVGEKIIRLEEFLEIAAGHEKRKPGVYIETKAPENSPGIEAELVAVLRAKGWIEEEDPPEEEWINGKIPPHKVILQSFNKDSLARLKELVPRTPRVYLVNSKMEEAEGWPTMVNRAQHLGSGIGPVAFLAWPWYMEKAHAAGLIVHPYTLNPGWLRWLVNQFGADGFFTDRPDLGLQMYGRAPNVDINRILEGLGY